MTIQDTAEQTTLDITRDLLVALKGLYEVARQCDRFQLPDVANRLTWAKLAIERAENRGTR